MNGFIEQFLNGLIPGSIYALIALGYTMVYGIAKMINFAHGDIIMVGAYLLLLGLNASGVPIGLAILLSIVGCGILGVVIEKVAYKPLRNAPSLAVLITAIGVSYFLQNLFLVIFTSQGKSVPKFIHVSDFTVGGVTVSGNMIVILVVTIIVMIALTYFINKTKLGSALRAVSEDKGAASLMGINANRMISMTFAIGSALAGVAGILWVSMYDKAYPTLGAIPGIKAFVAAVIGGIGSVPGAMLGGIALGIVESFTKAYISGELVDAFVFGLLIIVLIFKPTGILGRKRIEKV
ncbi:MAG: branched-chain amino acid ABC transporter permease [bacterium]|nr:branched-chain amino acid ABC transporter permease [bacterium]